MQRFAGLYAVHTNATRGLGRFAMAGQQVDERVEGYL